MNDTRLSAMPATRARRSFGRYVRLPILASVALASSLLIAWHPPIAGAENALGERWVGSWATAVVVRPLVPPGPPPGIGPAPPNQPAAAPIGGTPPADNQTAQSAQPTSAAGAPAVPPGGAPGAAPAGGRGRGGFPALNLNDQ